MDLLTLFAIWIMIIMLLLFFSTIKGASRQHNNHNEDNCNKRKESSSIQPSTQPQLNSFLLPVFTSANSKTWFEHAEAQLRLHKIISEQDKCDCIILALTKDNMFRIHQTILSCQQDKTPYTMIKHALIAAYPYMESKPSHKQVDRDSLPSRLGIVPNTFAATTSLANIDTKERSVDRTMDQQCSTPAQQHRPESIQTIITILDPSISLDDSITTNVSLCDTITADLPLAATIQLFGDVELCWYQNTRSRQHETQFVMAEQRTDKTSP